MSVNMWLPAESAFQMRGVNLCVSVFDCQQHGGWGPVAGNGSSGGTDNIQLWFKILQKNEIQKDMSWKEALSTLQRHISERKSSMKEKVFFKMKYYLFYAVWNFFKDVKL